MKEPALVHARYEPREELGRGAEGVVVRVVDRQAPDLGLVAKVMRPRAKGITSLTGEFALLARARIQGLVRAHDLGRCERTGSPFIVEDFIDGPDAATWVHDAPDEPGQKSARLAEIVCGVATTLAGLHDLGFVHGDLKPAHVRITRTPPARPVLLDLGAATHRGHTPLFAAPEVIAGAPSSPRSDLYGLGATAWAIAAKTPYLQGARLRSAAPWLRPSLAAIIERLVALHPSDRPESAIALLSALGREGIASPPPPPIGREGALATLLTPSIAGVRYITGPSGAGKSHLLAEVATRALLEGRRVARAHNEALALLQRERGAATSTERVLVALDDPAPDLARAVEVFRCRADRDPDVEVIVASRQAPEGAAAIALGPLDDASFTALCNAVGIRGEAAIEGARAASAGLAGWVVASAGSVPLHHDTAIARGAALSPEAREIVGLVAVAGGDVPKRAARAFAEKPVQNALAELFRASLLERHMTPDGGVSIALTAPVLAPALAGAFASPGLLPRAARALLEAHETSPAALVTAASSPFVNDVDKAALLREAAHRARREGLAADETRALFALCESPLERTAPLLRRLERLARDAGSLARHPEVLDWLDEAALADPSIVPLALRRRAEKLARDGAADKALALAERAQAASRGAPVEEALSLATQGSILLYRASYEEAFEALSGARQKLASFTADPEEIARIDHNLGVVAHYRGAFEEAAQAFERSLAIKRSLGDAAGARSCLLNLGLARAKLGLLDDAERALDEALRLATSLGQAAGRGWVLAALADVAVKRRDAESAARWLGESEALESSLPAAVKADLAILRAEVAWMKGDPRAAQKALAEIDDDMRQRDHEIASRVEEITRRLSNDQGRDEGGAWEWLAALAEGLGRRDATLALGAMIARESGAERVFLALGGDVIDGVDMDGLPIAEPRARFPAAIADKARDVGAPVIESDGKALARAAATAGSAAVVLEHRFSPSAFDTLDPGSLRRWALLAAVVARIDGGASAGAGSVEEHAPASAPPTPHTLPSRAEARANTPSPQTTLFTAEGPTRAFPTIVGSSPAIRRALAKLEAALDTPLPVLITGETGTGKELFARALHDLGPRSKRPFVAVNCAAIAESLFEAELFGHARGSFTGADRARAGLIAEAEGGTLFLDEIGELPLGRQASLLRALESKRYRPVGSDDERAFDVRLVAATNRDLAREAAQGTFRQDLYFRLDVLSIRVPPLREREGDIPELCRALLARAGSPSTFTPAAQRALASYGFPGNVRELAHLIDKLALVKAPVLDVHHLPRAMRGPATPAPLPSSPRASRGRASPHEERDDVERALASTGGNISRAATALGLTRHGLKKKMLRLGMREPHVVRAPHLKAVRGSS